MKKLAFLVAGMIVFVMALFWQYAPPIEARGTQETVPDATPHVYLPWVVVEAAPTATPTATASATATATQTPTATSTAEPSPTTAATSLPTPPSDVYFNLALLQRCDPNAGVTYVQGTTYIEGAPQSGYLVAFSWAPDGPVVAYIQSGPHPGYPGWSPGFYSHILQSNGPREGDWYFWIIDENQARISEIAYVHTDGVAGDGKCQQAVIDFDSRGSVQAPTPAPSTTGTPSATATSTPTSTPTSSVTPSTAAFQLVSHYLVDVVENGGRLDGDSVSCGEKHELRVQVLNREGALLDGVAVQGIWTNEIYVTGVQGKGTGTAEFVLWGSGEDVRVLRDVGGNTVTSDVAARNTTQTREIPDEQLIQARYCRDTASCAAFKEQFGCNGHFSWRATFRER